MVLFVIEGIILMISFYLVTYFFNKNKWSVFNYKKKIVPYSLGTIFMGLVLVDFFAEQIIVQSQTSIIFLLVVWSLGLIDDIYGKPYPKGLRGHFTVFFKEKQITTGFLKAIGVFIVAAFYFLANFQLREGYIFILIVLLPHMMNLLDTKPLRVWKVTIFLFFIPLLIISTTLNYMAIFLFTFALWAMFEMMHKAMLGDNGAMLLGGILAVITLQLQMTSFSIVLLCLSFCLTLLAERISIQAWIEKTPIIREIDQLGRIK